MQPMRPTIFVLTALLAACSGASKKPACGPASEPQASDLPTLSFAQLQQAAQQLAGDCLRQSWIADFIAEHKRKPTVRLHPLRDRTRHRPDLPQLSKLLEMELLTRVQVVAGVDDAARLRETREKEAVHSSDRAARMGNETAADYIMTGWVLETEDAIPGGGKVRGYTISLELLDVTIAKKVWRGHRVEKMILRSRASDICR